MLAPKTPGAGVLIGTEQTQAWRATLAADIDHPFFFDHPLDHVPGILLVTALLELVRAAATAEQAAPTPSWIRTALWFPQFGELGEPTELRVVSPAAGGGCWAVNASQSSGSVCHGWVTCGPVDEPAAPPAARPAGPAEAAGREWVDGVLVHRVRRENILVGPVSEGDDGVRRSAVVGSPAEDHFFTVRGGGVRHAEELIEAARQIAVLLWPYEHGWPTDVRLSLNRLRAELPATVDASRPLELRWRPNPLRGTKARARLELHDGTADGAPLGRFDIETQGWTESQWQRLRARPR
jgi:hypothetical protein